ncbi:hypothetical protein C8F04DRAFT_1236614 [Mycena alexandri]|uniref:DUF202 domain-containing protein n=1 Tax=Mycena alexandri TaxID=1745969 RepID=A0AAD6SM90_9AGAR|nr:hypothetical protein C8F04DRAFT_1236614 [Mycena alexandri]
MSSSAPAQSSTPPNPQTPLLSKPSSKSDVTRDASRYLPLQAEDGRARPLLSGRPSFSVGVEAAPGRTENQTQDSLGVSLVLENTGSVARDHLASERTFLAYVRTSLTMASAGVALAQLLSLSERLEDQLLVPLKTYAHPLAGALIVLALYVLFIGVSRYFAIQEALTRGMFPLARARVGVIALSMAVVVALLFGMFVAEGSSQL